MMPPDAAPAIWASAGVTAVNLITTSTCRPWPPLTGRRPHVPHDWQLPRSPLVSVQVRTAKQAIWVPLNEAAGQPVGSPQVPAALVQVPHTVPGPSLPQAATVLGIPVFGSS